MKKYIHMITIAAMVSMTTAAHANYACGGPVSYLGMQSNGLVVVSLGAPANTPSVDLCQIGNTVSNGFTSDGCRVAYATLLAAKLTGKSVNIYFGNDGLTCSTQPAWTPYVDAYFIDAPY